MAKSEKMLMSEIWIVETVLIVDITKYFLFRFWILIFIFQISPPCSGHHCPYFGHHSPYFGHHFFYCSCSGHQKLMSGIWAVFSVHILDIKSWWTTYGQPRLFEFPTSKVNFQNMLDNHISGKLMSRIGTVMPGTWAVMSGIRTLIFRIGKKYLSLFWSPIFDVLNMDNRNCPYSRHKP